MTLDSILTIAAWVVVAVSATLGAAVIGLFLLSFTGMRVRLTFGKPRHDDTEVRP